MSKTSISIWVKSLVAAVFFGALVGAALYFFSERFFAAKNLQTLLKDSELKSSSSDVVLVVGQKVPNLDLVDFRNDKPYSIESVGAESDIVFLNFWSSTCEPCVEEFTSFARLLKKFDGRVSFIGLSEDSTEEEAKDFLLAFKSDFSTMKGVYFSFDKTKSFANQFGVLALPETFILNSKGELLKRVTGFEVWDSPEAIKFIESLIEREKK